jgi:hypothetical protein
MPYGEEGIFQICGLVGALMFFLSILGWNRGLSKHVDV